MADLLATWRKQRAPGTPSGAGSPAVKALRGTRRSLLRDPPRTPGTPGSRRRSRSQPTLSRMVPQSAPQMRYPPSAASLDLAAYSPVPGGIQLDLSSTLAATMHSPQTSQGVGRNLPQPFHDFHKMYPNRTSSTCANQSNAIERMNTLGKVWKEQEPVPETINGTPYNVGPNSYQRPQNIGAKFGLPDVEFVRCGCGLDWCKTRVIKGRKRKFERSCECC